MSERMIELQRERLLAASGGKGSSASQASSSVPISNGPQASPSSNHGTSAATAPDLANNSLSPEAMAAAATAAAAAARADKYHLPPDATPQQIAAMEQRREDDLMQTFLHRLQNRTDSRAQSTSAPTVPTALTRRMLQRQGVGYLDDTVAAVVSGAADRFLATVLQQAAACRDQRLKGAEMAREARRHRKRHMQQYEADVAERHRRIQDREQRRELDNIAAIRAAEALKNKGSHDKTAADSGGSAGKSKKKKKTDETTQMNGNKRKSKGGGDYDDDDDDEESYDSIDEEEEYYQEHYNDDIMLDTNSDDDEDDEMLILRDIARPLEAWDFHLDGKVGMEPAVPAEEEDEGDLDGLDSDDDMIDTRQEQQQQNHDDSTDDGEKEGAVARGINKTSPTTASRAVKTSLDDKKSPARKTSSTPTTPPTTTTTTGGNKKSSSLPPK